MYERLSNGCRALDLMDEKGFICGKILGALGVDVIKVERPGGEPARGIPPWTGEQRFSNLELKKKHEDELERLVSEWTQKHTADEVMEFMQDTGVAAGGGPECPGSSGQGPSFRRERIGGSAKAPGDWYFRPPDPSVQAVKDTFRVADGSLSR